MKIQNIKVTAEFWFDSKCTFASVPFCLIYCTLKWFSFHFFYSGRKLKSHGKNRPSRWTFHFSVFWMSIYLKTATCMTGWRWKSSRWRAIMYLSVMLVMLAWICCLKNALHIKNKFRGFLRHSFCKVLPYSFCNAILGFWFSLILDKQVSERYNILVCGLFHTSVIYISVILLHSECWDRK